MRRSVQVVERQRIRGGGASLSAVESRDSTVQEDFVPVFVEVIEIRLVVGKLTCLLPCCFVGRVQMWIKCFWQFSL